MTLSNSSSIFCAHTKSKRGVLEIFLVFYPFLLLGANVTTAGTTFLYGSDPPRNPLYRSTTEDYSNTKVPSIKCDRSRGSSTARPIIIVFIGNIVDELSLESDTDRENILVVPPKKGVLNVAVVPKISM